MNAEAREKKIIQTSIIGIIANIFLAAFKAGVGIVSHSVAIVLDAVNNLSDALSSLITIIGTKLAGKAPDKKHPLGHGRIEYLSTMIIAVIILYAGITSLVESVKKILHPETPDYSAVTLIIVAVAVAVKILLGTYVKKTGQQVGSDALVASGSDAMFDSIISASTLVAAVIFLATGIKLEAWLGAAISLVIIKSGYEMLQDTISDILGKRVEADLARAVKASITSFPEVTGAYDLVVHNYGPNLLIGSVHIEIPDTMKADEIDLLERAIQAKVTEENGVVMTGISVYSLNTSNPKAKEMRLQIRKMLDEYPEILQMHGFYLDDTAKTIRFDAIIDFAAKDRMATFQEICGRVQKMYPDYKPQITMDFDISD